MLLGEHTDIELRVPTLLPESFIPDVNMRLSIYKRIASTSCRDELDDLGASSLPTASAPCSASAAQNLLQVAEYRQQSTHLGIKRIEVSERGGYIDFAEQTRVSPGYLVSLLQSQPRIYRMEGPTRPVLPDPLCRWRRPLAAGRQLAHWN